MNARCVPFLIFTALVLGSGGAQKLEAQLGAPLEVLCTSHAQEYCLAFLTYEATFDATEDSGLARFSSLVQLFGSAVAPGASGRFIVETFVYGQTLNGADCATGLTALAAVSGPGLYGIADVSGGCSSVTGPARPPSPADVSALVFQIDGAFAQCSTRGEGDACVSVPEPASLLLLLTGLLATGFLRSRRRAVASRAV